MDNLDEFLPDSLTAYRSKLGLGSLSGHFLIEDDRVVLNWPYKDCILEGKQTKETAKSEEKFYHEVIAESKINRLFEPKVFTDWQRHSRGNTSTPKRLQNTDNYIIRGNNLVVLHSLKPRYAEAVNLIYIDVPFNTGNDSFSYNDRFSHSTWLTFMKNRLEIARDLLAKNGSIFIQADWHEVHYLKVLLDEIFGRDNFINEIIWCYTGPGSPQLQHLNRKHDTILWYAKNADDYVFNKDAVRVPYASVHQSMRKSLADSNGWTDADVSRMRERGRIPDDWWSDIPVAARIPVDGEKRTGYSTEKPVKLLERIIKMASNSGDLVLDFFAGSGTTLYAAANLKRHFIGVEQLRGAYRLMVERLDKAGASFVTCSLRDDAENFAIRVRKANDEALPELFRELKTARFLRPDLKFDLLNSDDFINLKPEDQKSLILELIDPNSLYVHYAEMCDPENYVSASDQRLNKLFYGQHAS